MSFIKYVFTPNYAKYEGVRPINIYLLRVLYFLMFVGVGLQTWSTIINHQGPWDHTKAVAFCVWAAYPTLSIFGLLRPLKVAADRDLHDLLQDALGYRGGPLWRAGALAGSPAEEMAHIFIWAPVIILIVPWVYVLKNYVLWSKPKVSQ
jgi:hypothetical protein